MKAFFVCYERPRYLKPDGPIFPAEIRQAAQTMYPITRILIRHSWQPFEVILIYFYPNLLIMMGLLNPLKYAFNLKLLLNFYLVNWLQSALVALDPNHNEEVLQTLQLL